MDPFTLDVLVEVCQSSRGTSSVSLAVDLVNRGRLKPLGDPFGLVLYAIDALALDGLVTYRLGHYAVPVGVRATDEGYRVAGYPVAKHQVGDRFHRRDEVPVHNPNDRTDFRTHRDSAVGGEIERMSIEEHCSVYYDHADIHLRALEEWWDRMRRQ